MLLLLQSCLVLLAHFTLGSSQPLARAHSWKCSHTSLEGGSGIGFIPSGLLNFSTSMQPSDGASGVSLGLLKPSST